MMNKYDNQYAQKIFEIISPILGEVMAGASIKLHCDKIGTTANDLQKKDLSTFSVSISRGLIVFIGSDGARQIAQKITAL